MLSARSDTRAFVVLAAVLVALAWVAILAWGSSPYASYLHHESLGRLDSPVSAAFASRLLYFSAAWLLMTVAMMLPTSIPLISLFRTMTGARANRDVLVSLLVGGYLVVWGLFGVLAYVGDLGVHEGVSSLSWLDQHSGLITAAVLVLAGGYQFTPLKYYCVEKCRSPYSFIMGHWHGESARREAFALGIAHGAFCVGCCWSLMLVMFAIGMGSAAWMLALALVMGIEKNFAWGRSLTPALGVVLVAAGITVAALGGGSACAC